jgi:hypothetical protein
MPVILATSEAEIGRILVGSHPGKKIFLGKLLVPKLGGTLRPGGSWFRSAQAENLSESPGQQKRAGCDDSHLSPQ